MRVATEPVEIRYRQLLLSFRGALIALGHLDVVKAIEENAPPLPPPPIMIKPEDMPGAVRYVGDK